MHLFLSRGCMMHGTWKTSPNKGLGYPSSNNSINEWIANSLEKQMPVVYRAVSSRWKRGAKGAA